MKRFFSLWIFIGMTFISKAQTGELWVKSGDKGLFLEHKVMPKEGLYSLGRLYTVHPKFLAKYNSLDITKGLVLGQIVRIPLTDTNFNQKNNNGIPVYYKAGEKDGLMHISTVHNKVSLASLREWNSLQGDNINFGDKLVIGFLASKEMNTAAQTKKEAQKNNPPKNVEMEYAKMPEEKEEAKQPVKIIQPKQKPEKELRDYAEIPDARKDGIKTVEMKEPESKPEIVNAVKIDTGEGGFFKWHFEQQAKQQLVSKDQTVTSGIFKTTSGWTDGKYYLLIDGVQPGTIVKITNPTTNKTVFAKVLGQMEGINLNKGLDIRISNAAASNLGVSEIDKFIVKVNYVP